MSVKCIFDVLKQFLIAFLHAGADAFMPRRPNASCTTCVKKMHCNATAAAGTKCGVFSPYTYICIDRVKMVCGYFLLVWNLYTAENLSPLSRSLLSLGISLLPQFYVYYTQNISDVKLVCVYAVLIF